MTSEPSSHPTASFKKGDAIEVDRHGLTEAGERWLSTTPGTVTRVYKGAIYTDVQHAPFDEATFLPLGPNGGLVAPEGVVSLLRHADDPYLQLPSIEIIAAMGLPNLKDWKVAILEWNEEGPVDEI